MQYPACHFLAAQKVAIFEEETGQDHIFYFYK